VITWSVIYLYDLMSRNEERAPFSGEGVDEIPPSIQAILSSYQVRWLNKQCDRLKSKKREILTEAFDEWLVRHSDEIICTGNLGELVSVALDEFINRHRDEFLPMDQET
jgi:uncharacterized protein (DUF4213/DUF364 family)